MPRESTMGMFVSGKTALLLLAVGVSALSVSAAPTSSARLFAAHNGGLPAGLTTPKNPFAIRQRLVSLDASLLSSNGPARFSLNPFDDTDLDGHRDRLQQDDDYKGRKKSSWIGSIGSSLLSSVVFASTEHGTAGSIRTLDRIYEILPLTNSTHVVFEIDPLAFSDELEPKRAPVSNAAPNFQSAPSLVKRQSNPILDVLVAYTTQARLDAGSTTAIESAIALAITETNDAYAQSGVLQRLRLVGSMEVSYVTAGFNTDLSRVTSVGDGFLDEVSSAREALGADLVSLWITDTTYCGLAWLNTAPSSQSAYGYSVVSRSCATGFVLRPIKPT